MIASLWADYSSCRKSLGQQVIIAVVVGLVVGGDAVDARFFADVLSFLAQQGLGIVMLGSVLVGAFALGAGGHIAANLYEVREL